MLQKMRKVTLLETSLSLKPGDHIQDPLKPFPVISSVSCTETAAKPIRSPVCGPGPG